MFSSAAPHSHAHLLPEAFLSDGPRTSWESNSTVRTRTEGLACSEMVCLEVLTRLSGLVEIWSGKIYRSTVFHKRQLAAEGNSFRLLFPHFSFCTGDLSASDTSLVDLVERHRGPLPPELMPLPSSDRDSPLEWTHLVDVANTFETERNTHYGSVPGPCRYLPLCCIFRTLKDGGTRSLNCVRAKLDLWSVSCFLSVVQRSFVFGESNHRSSGASSPQQPHIELHPVPLSRPTSR